MQGLQEGHGRVAGTGLSARIPYNSQKFDLLALAPEGMPEQLLPAWVVFLQYALGTPEIVATYRRETGDSWEPGRTPIERMIDEATGRDVQFLRDVIPWVNHELWGDDWLGGQPND